MKKVCALLVFVAVNAAAGMSYNLKSSTGTGGRVVADGANVRLEMENGAVLLTNDGGKTLTFLDPTKKTYTTMSAADLVGMDIKVANPKTTTRDLGDGGAVEGYPTRRWAVETSFDATIDTFSVHLSMRSESWRTEQLPEAAASIFASQSTRTGVAEIDKVLESMASANVKGFPLKEVTTLRSKSANGKETSTTSTIEVHDIKRVNTTKATFAIPAGYKRK
jgi:Domain of unknown function (DUF4412)